MKFELTDKELKMIARRRRWERREKTFVAIIIVAMVMMASLAALAALQSMGKHGQYEYVLPDDTIITSNGLVYLDGVMLPKSEPLEVSPLESAMVVLVILGLGFYAWWGYKDYQDEQAEYEAFINKAKETGSIN